MNDINYFELSHKNTDKKICNQIILGMKPFTFKSITLWVSDKIG